VTTSVLPTLIGLPDPTDRYMVSVRCDPHTGIPLLIDAYRIGTPDPIASWECDETGLLAASLWALDHQAVSCLGFRIHSVESMPVQIGAV
jgi:hypothetical protein